MFNRLEEDTLLKSVSASRVNGLVCSEVVINTLTSQYDFGQGFFHKILTRSVLKPGSLRAEEPVMEATR